MQYLGGKRKGFHGMKIDLVHKSRWRPKNSLQGEMSRLFLQLADSGCFIASKLKWNYLWSKVKLLKWNYLWSKVKLLGGKVTYLSIARTYVAWNFVKNDVQLKFFGGQSKSGGPTAPSQLPPPLATCLKLQNQSHGIYIKRFKTDFTYLGAND